MLQQTCSTWTRIQHHVLTLQQPSYRSPGCGGPLWHAVHVDATPRALWTMFVVAGSAGRQAAVGVHAHHWSASLGKPLHDACVEGALHDQQKNNNNYGSITK